MKGVPDAIHHTDTSETLEYITGWNDCRAAMLAEQPAQPYKGIADHINQVTNGRMQDVQNKEQP